MDHLATDCRFAVRLLLRSPMWAAIAIASLALGIGANAVVFSLVDAVLLDPFPYKGAGQLVLLWGSKSEEQTTGISGADLADWRDESRSFEDIDAFLGGNMGFSLGAIESDRVKAACIGHRVLPMLGVLPALGRNFTEAEARYGAHPVTLISEELWRTRYASTLDVVGTTIRLDDVPYEIVGVMPAGFFFPDTDVRLWVPAPCGLSGFDARGAMSLNAIGRLKLGVSVKDAQTDIDRINRALALAYPATNQRRSTGVFSLRRIVIGKYEQALWTLVWAIAVVLLIACANVVHLQLARGIDRETELAVRSASGASRGRLLRQLLTESSLLVAISATVALFVAWFGLRLMHAFALSDIPRMENARIDVRVLGFTLVVSVATALLSGLWPAWKASGVRVSDTLKLGSTATTSASRSQIRDVLAVTQIAAAVTLLVASGLIVKSFVQLSTAEWGFNPQKLLLVDVKLPRDRWRDRVFHRDFTEAVMKTLKTVPGVEHVAVSEGAPIRWGGWWPRPVSVDGRPVSDITAAVWVVGRGHFSTAGIALREGREFSEADDESAPNRVMLSRELSRRLWSGQSAIGKSLKILEMRMVNGKPDPSILSQMKKRSGWPSDPRMYEAAGGGDWEVIGIVDDVRMFGLGVQPNPALYVESRQARRTPSWFGGTAAKIMIRTSDEPTKVAELARTHIMAAAPDVTITEIVPLANLVAQSIGGRGSAKLLLIVAMVFGTLALTFATIGIYGVVSHSVSQRLREIGIRVALGAAGHDVIRIVLSYGIRLLAGGLALGITAAWAATRGMGALLFATKPTDAATYGAVVLTLVIAALLACVLPLRRALRFDPVTLFKA